MTAQVSTRLKFVVQSVGVICLSGIILAGCSLGDKVKNLLRPSETPPASSTNSIMLNQPVTPQPSQPSGGKAATNSDQDMATENSNLKKLDQDSVTVDQSFNDQAINVN